MMEVALHGAEFFARHGYYPEEQLMGNKFVVDVEVGFNPANNLNDDELANTLNYEQLYIIVCEEMKITRQLLETVVQSIIDRIKTDFSFAETIKVRLKKLNPPLKGKVEASSVTITYTK
ncbi:dihydroneopterin aldolase [Mucilaginibacter jinjuensis]|uniref:7,8-dihydroneopterin aldolase n=1 Tax=Mucilaginibacter jinjuensis TaxID=1176721 RepID=A0ABY7TEW2_9SPHI|nr:dihydroneopterin aldolase [Mucilaginibacter jinjuensis]WCT15001.1 dihydroneopterin aldolase [Mucilaginibacter jinjuensis]